MILVLQVGRYLFFGENESGHAECHAVVSNEQNMAICWMYDLLWQTFNDKRCHMGQRAQTQNYFPLFYLPSTYFVPRFP